MSAPERAIAVIGTHHTSDLAVRDMDPRWTEIHRALGWTRLDRKRVFCYVACGNDFESFDIPVSLSSGEITGALCARCFGHLARGAA
jgi:hypothetical protein